MRFGLDLRVGETNEETENKESGGGRVKGENVGTNVLICEEDDCGLNEVSTMVGLVCWLEWLWDQTFQQN